MIEQLNSELKDVKEKLRWKEKWEEQLKNVHATLASEKEKQHQLQLQLEKEQKDVDRLEGLSVASIFYTFRWNNC